MPRPSYTLEDVKSDAVKKNLTYLYGYVSSCVDRCEYACNVCDWVGTKTARNVRSGRGCPRCAKKELVTVEKVQRQANVVGLEYVSGYTRTHAKATYKCLTEGCGWSGDKTPYNVSAGSGCPRCTGKERLSEDRLQKDALAVGLQYSHGFTTVGDLTTYVCLQCGSILKKTPTSVTSGFGCKFCSFGGFNHNKKGYFYVYRISDYIGYGITNNHDHRLKQHKRQFKKHAIDFEVLELFEFVIGSDAADVERLIKSKFKPVSSILGFVTESASMQHLNEILNMVKGAAGKCLINTGEENE